MQPAASKMNQDYFTFIGAAMLRSFFDISENDGLSVGSEAQQLSIRDFHSGSHHVGICGRNVLFTIPPAKEIQCRCKVTQTSEHRQKQNRAFQERYVQTQIRKDIIQVSIMSKPFQYILALKRLYIHVHWLRNSYTAQPKHRQRVILFIKVINILQT